MNNAIAMMLKSMGFDPNQLLQSIGDMGRMIAEMHASQMRTEQMVKQYIDRFTSLEEKHNVLCDIVKGKGY